MAAGPVTGTAQLLPHTTAPSVPSSLMVTSTTSTSIALSWNASSDTGGSGLAGYRIYRDGTAIGTVASASTSTVISFEGYSTGAILTSATVDGYVFTSQHFHLFGDDFGFASNGTTYMAYESGRGYPITMVRADGGAFSILGLDGAEAVTSDPIGRPPAEAIGLLGTRPDGGTVSAQLALDGINDGGNAGSANDFQNFPLSPALTNLTSVVFYGIRSDARDGGIAVDNLTIVSGGSVQARHSRTQGWRRRAVTAIK